MERPILAHSTDSGVDSVGSSDNENAIDHGNSDSEEEDDDDLIYSLLSQID